LVCVCVLCVCVDCLQVNGLARLSIAKSGHLMKNLQSPSMYHMNPSVPSVNRPVRRTVSKVRHA
jgi:hypothetical protein